MQTWESSGSQCCWLGLLGGSVIGLRVLHPECRAAAKATILPLCWTLLALNLFRQQSLDYCHHPTVIAWNAVVTVVHMVGTNARVVQLKGFSWDTHPNHTD